MRGGEGDAESGLRIAQCIEIGKNCVSTQQHCSWEMRHDFVCWREINDNMIPYWNVIYELVYVKSQSYNQCNQEIRILYFYALKETLYYWLLAYYFDHFFAIKFNATCILNKKANCYFKNLEPFCFVFHFNNHVFYQASSVWFCINLFFLNRTYI
jgi:hypothetical protein